MKLAHLICGVLLALGVGCTGGEKSVKKMMEPLLPPSPGEVAREAFNVYDADLRRRSVHLLAASKFGGEAPYVKLYRLLADDPDPTVRAAAIQALGLHGAPEDSRLVLRRMTDDSEYVRWEAAQALQKIHDPNAVGPLLEALRNDQDADVRGAAARALGQYAEPRVFEALVGALDDTNFTVVQASRESLHVLTGQDLGTDGSEWLAWAQMNRGELFKNQQVYVWQPYVQPRGVLRKAQFWRPRPDASPRLPKGMEPGLAGEDESAG